MMVGGLWIFRLFTVNFSKNFKPPQHRQRNIVQASRVDRSMCVQTYPESKALLVRMTGTSCYLHILK